MPSFVGDIRHRLGNALVSEVGDLRFTNFWPVKSNTELTTARRALAFFQKEMCCPHAVTRNWIQPWPTLDTAPHVTFLVEFLSGRRFFAKKRKLFNAFVLVARNGRAPHTLLK